MVKSFQSVFFLLIGIMMFATPGSAQDTPFYRLQVRLSPESHSLEGRAVITVPAGKETELKADLLTVREWLVDGKTFPTLKAVQERLREDHKEKIIEVVYQKDFSAAGKNKNLKNPVTVGGNAIDPSGVVLLSGWYPELSSDCRYQLTAVVPSTFTAVSESESDRVESNQAERVFHFDFSHPLSGITLVAGPYHVQEETFDGITIRTLFFPEDKALAATYLKHARGYLEDYQNLLGRYPYPLFSIVENRFQTGYSFPTYTLLGSEVVKLPFIVKTSLGHEILHQWFGNTLFVDKEGGNWSEGITTYLADQRYQAQEGKGAAYRKKILINYQNYLSPDRDYPLKDFRERKDHGDQAIGYGKAAMVFHMLRKRIGDDKFFQGLKELISSHAFTYTSWKDFQKAFEKASGKDLQSFFQPWLNRKGIPSLSLSDPMILYRDGQYRLVLDIMQKGTPFPLDLPIRVTSGAKSETFRIRCDRAEVTFTHNFPEKPVRLVVDEGYDVMRRLTKEELPPVLSSFTGSEKKLLILPAKDGDTYQDAVDFFKQEGATVKDEKDVRDDDLQEQSVMILSTHNWIYRRLFATDPLPDGGLAVKVRVNPIQAGRSVVILQAKDRDECAKACWKISHYGNYSDLIFDHGKIVSKAIASSDTGIVRNLKISVDGVETSKTLDLNGIFQKVRDQRLIFVGEMHPFYADHVMQYEIIRKLFAAKGKVIIGMEMFQKPYQKYLDDYVQGKIDEAEMLKKTEYFTRWKFDYNLYRDILQFARANKIPVIALNLQEEIIKKVSRKGIGALTKEEYAQIPHDIDMTNSDYRKSVREIYQQHPHHGNSGEERPSFENFFQSQILWDETMAHTIAATLEKRPKTPMVVLAGNGHLQYSWGIPSRVRRITGIRGTVILNEVTGPISKDLADYVLYPEEMETPESPKLMVLLKEKKEGLEVVKLIPGGPSEKAGIEEGDIITGIDKQDVKNIADVRIVLLERAKGDSIQVRIQRKRVLLGSKEMTIEVKL